MLLGEQKQPGLFSPLWIPGVFFAALLLGGSWTAAQSPSLNDPQGRGFITQSWEDDFEKPYLDKSRWTIEDWRSPAWQFPAPGYLPSSHLGVYEEQQVRLVPGAGRQYLRLALTQEKGPVDENPDGVISRGALVYSKEKFGYGTYEWRMRMSSSGKDPEDPLAGAAVSGSVSAGFIYVNNSETEIDVEFAGHTVDTPFPELVYATSWNNQTPASGPTGLDMTFAVLPVPGLYTTFHTYAFEWKPDSVTFSIDGVAQIVHRSNIPSAPAHFMINHWGADRPDGFGGKASIGVARYLFVDWVRFTPLRGERPSRLPGGLAKNSATDRLRTRIR